MVVYTWSGVTCACMRATAALLLLVTIAVVAPQGLGKRHVPTLAAKKQFSIGQAAMNRNEPIVAAGAFRKAIDLDPDYFDAHFYYIRARYLGKTGTQFAEQTELLTALYKRWAARHPEKALYPWALGYINQTNTELASHYYEQAIHLDPKFAEAYADLAFVKNMQGDEAGALAAYKQAAEVSQDPGWLAEYFYALVDVNPEAAESLVEQEFKKKYPKSEWTAGVMAAMADIVPPQQRQARLEEVKTMFPPASSEHSAWAMRELYQDYLLQDPEKAVALAKEMSRLRSAKDDPKRQETWAAYETAATGIAGAKRLIAARQFVQALAILNNVQLTLYATSESPLPFLLAQCEDGLGETKAAYDRIVHVLARKPTRMLRQAALAYGAKLGKSDKDMDHDAWKLVEEQAQPAFDFSLPRYGDQKDVRLSDYHGQVVLLDFWFPGCGPCRGQFPFLEQVFNKYSSSGKLGYLGINVSPDEDSYVMSFITSHRYHFTPLKADRTFAQEKYKAAGYPSTYLIDAQGRIIATVSARTAEGEKILEMQVEAALANARI